MMIPSELLSIIGRRHFIAEVRTETAKQALSVVEALARGGITIFEISTGIPGWDEIMRHFANNTEIVIGAGGVLDARQAAEAAGAGARFVATPIVAPEIVPACVERHVMPILGALTPTEIIMAQRAGAEMVKIVPVSALGGPQYIRSLYRHLAHLSIMVSGGVTIETLPDYLALPVRALALSSTLTPRALIEQGDWAALSQIARRFVEYATAWENAAVNAPARVVATDRPLLPDTIMAPAPHISTPPAGMPLPQTPAPPASVPPGFKPWDSKPAPPGPGEDWIR